jgi:hypothetical protein
MKDISSEAKKAGLQEPEKAIDEMTEEELKVFRNSFDPDMMGFDGDEGADEEEADENGSK